MRQRIFIWVIIFFYFSPTFLFSQIDDITWLPAQNIADTLSESAPAVLSESEVIIFFINSIQDRISSISSNDGGKNWGIPNTVIREELDASQSYYHLTALRSSSGRIFIAWAKAEQGMLIFSDDNGSSWSQPQMIVSVGDPAFQRKVENLNLSQLDDGKILISFDDNRERVIYFKHSSDDGVLWSEEVTEVYSRPPPFKVNGLSVVNSTGEKLLAVFEFYLGYTSGIYKLISTDNGFTWSDTIKIVNTELYETRPKIVRRSDGSLLLTYLRGESTQIADFSQDDIYYMISSDGGESWQGEKRFTKYVGNDDFINISHLNGKTFISFASQRFTNNFQISYGILEETVESYKPPYVYNYNFLFQGEDFTAPTTYRATVIDDDGVEKVEAGYEESSIIKNLYDDGMHDDLEPNDNVWGNTFIPAQVRNTDSFTMSVNNIILPFSNNGILADKRAEITGPSFTIASDINDHILTANTPTARRTYTGGRFEEGRFLFSGGFYLSGYNGNELWANGVASVALTVDYLPGRVGSEPEHPLNVIYTIDKKDPPFGYYGIYNPVDKNWNGTWDPNEDMPALIGDATSWCVYNDGVPSEMRRFDEEPLGIEIQQTLFASGLPELQNVIFIKYKIENAAIVSEELDSVFFSFADDVDLGVHFDDLGASDTLINSVYTYNQDDDDVYRVNPPAVYTALLQGPVVENENSKDTAYVRNGQLLGEEIFPGAKNLELFSFTNYSKGRDWDEPWDQQHVRNYVYGKSRSGIQYSSCDTILGKVLGGIDCNDINPVYWFSGDPVTQIGWIKKLSLDDRKFASVGPFNLTKDDPVEIIIATVIGRGIDEINSITVARENVRRVIQEYQSNFASMTYSPPPPTNPVTNYVLYHNYPNPFNPTTTIRYEIPQDGIVTIKVYDILGQEVRTILNEFKQADRYEVNFNAFGLASGVYIYRMKVNDYITSKKMILIR
jgi:hypothetical protein